MTTIDAGIQTCVICGSLVNVDDIISTTNFTYVDLDMRPRGPARFAEKNFVQYCPKCGYASYNLEKDITLGNHDVLSSEEYQMVVEDPMLPVEAKKFYLVGLILEKNEDYQRAATTYLRSSWFFSDLQIDEWMKKTRRRAIDCLLKSAFTWKNEQVTATLIDMYRRIGEFDKAVETVHTFGLENVKDPFYQKIFRLQLVLCANKDFSVHTSREIEL